MIDGLRVALWRHWLRLSGPVPEHLQTLERLRGSLGSYQEERLSVLLAHAAARVPFHRRRLAEAGAVVNGRVRLDRFTDIPPLTRAELRSRFADLTAEGADPAHCRINATGGSTGEPVRVLEDAGAHAWNAAAKLLFDGWSDYRPGQRRAVLWTSQHELPPMRLRPRLGRWLRGERWVDVLRLDEDALRAAAAALVAFRPRQILAFADRLHEIARLIEAGRLPSIPVDSLMVSSCACTPHMRAVIERAFAAPLFDRYGSRELGAVAGERVPGGGLVVSAPTHLVEVLRPDGNPAPPGEVGELVVTLLTNYAMPLIRYRIGDRAAWAVSDDPWPVLTRIEGRSGDVFRAMDGAAVDNALFLYALEERPWIARYRVVQDATDHVLVELVPAAPPPPEEVADIRRRIAAVLGDGCRVEVRMVDAIPLSPSGKLRTLVSRCPPRA